MLSLEDLQKKIIAFRDARDWKQFHTPKDLAVGLSLEAGEVLEHFHWKNDAEIAEHIKNHKEEIGDELADVLNYMLLMAHDFDIDLFAATLRKIEKTAQKYPPNRFNSFPDSVSKTKIPKLPTVSILLPSGENDT